MRQGAGDKKIGAAPGVQAPSVQVFVYPSGPSLGSDLGSANAKAQATNFPFAGSIGRPEDEPNRKTLDAARAEFDRRLADETRRSFEAGREQGRTEGRQAEREAQAGTVVTAERERVRKAAELLESFAREREDYFSGVEREVVELLWRLRRASYAARHRWIAIHFMLRAWFRLIMSGTNPTKRLVACGRDQDEGVDGQ